MKVHYPKLYNMAHLSLNVFTASKGSNHHILFAITAAGVVPCGGPKMSEIAAIMNVWLSLPVL